MLQVSSVTEHVSGQDTGTTAADFDDDDGGGMVSYADVLSNPKIFECVHQCNI